MLDSTNTTKKSTLNWPDLYLELSSCAPYFQVSKELQVHFKALDSTKTTNTSIFDKTNSYSDFQSSIFYL